MPVYKNTFDKMFVFYDIQSNTLAHKIAQATRLVAGQKNLPICFAIQCVAKKLDFLVFSFINWSFSQA